MPIGTVKWFDPVRGYGFIRPDDGSKDVFVHVTAVKALGTETLAEGQKIKYDLSEDRNGRLSATNLLVE